MVSGLPTRSQANSPKPFKGYVPVPRSFFDHPIWRKSRVFSQQDAMLDLYRQARSLPTERLKRGWFETPQSELAERWSWTRNRVTRFLDGLLCDGTLRKVGKNTFAVCELEQFPTKPANVQAVERPHVPQESAARVDLTPSSELQPDTETGISGQKKKERTKERIKALELRDVKSGERSPIPVGSLELQKSERVAGAVIDAVPGNATGSEAILVHGFAFTPEDYARLQRARGDALEAILAHMELRAESIAHPFHAALKWQLPVQQPQPKPQAQPARQYETWKGRRFRKSLENIQQDSAKLANYEPKPRPVNPAARTIERARGQS